MKTTLQNDYHNYVIKNGKFIGKFESMYQKCAKPWPEDISDLESNPISLYTVRLLRKYGFKKLFTMGSGKGLHANWLKTKIRHLEIEGCDVSKTVVRYSRAHYPKIKVRCWDVKNFGRHTLNFDIILLREILWYILPHWETIAKVLRKKYTGKYIIIELSCYDNQGYGREYFDGPEDLISRFPFQIIEILRHHITPLQREGMVLIFGKIK